MDMDLEMDKEMVLEIEMDNFTKNKTVKLVARNSSKIKGEKKCTIQ